MKFKIEKQKSPNISHYPTEDLDFAYKFASKAYKEFGSFLKAVVLFGSLARKQDKEHHDIDLLIIVDDLSFVMSPEMVETYRVITEKIIADVSTKLHITTLKFTAFWDYVRNCDPVGINLLRDGVSLFDSGFFEPLQALLRMGRIRPTQEAIWTYFVRAPRTLTNSKWHLLQATVDLYWAVIDASHAALMKLGEVPPSPEHVGDLLQVKMVNQGLLKKKYVETMKKFYKLSKMIVHREMKEIDGKQYEQYLAEATEFVDVMKKFIEEDKG